MKTKLNDIMKQSRARMCQALLLYGCFFTAPFGFDAEMEIRTKPAAQV